MWPRVVELMLGAWLVITPFVFREAADLSRYTLSTVTSGVIVMLASLLAFWDRARWARFITLAASGWLMAHGYFAAPRPGPPGAQNELTVGLLLLVFAILPNEINDPPIPWRRPAPPPSRSREI